MLLRHPSFVDVSSLSFPDKRVGEEASVLMLSYQTATVLPNNITRNRIAPSFKDSPRKPLRRLPKKCGVNRERNVSPVRNASER